MDLAVKYLLYLCVWINNVQVDSDVIRCHMRSAYKIEQLRNYLSHSQPRKDFTTDPSLCENSENFLSENSCAAEKGIKNSLHFVRAFFARVLY